MINTETEAAPVSVGRNVGPTLPPMIYLRGAGAAEETFLRLENAAHERGWATTRDYTGAWHLARSGFTKVVCCDFTPTTGGGLYSYHVRVELVRAKYNQDTVLLQGQHELVKVKGSNGGRLPRPEVMDHTRIDKAGQPGAFVLDTAKMIEHIANALSNRREQPNPSPSA